MGKQGPLLKVCSVGKDSSSDPMAKVHGGGVDGRGLRQVRRQVRRQIRRQIEILSTDDDDDDGIDRGGTGVGQLLPAS